MNSQTYIPERGDIVWVELNPRVGHEQSGKRPAIVLSKRLFGERTGLAYICPITSKVKGLAFEIRIKCGPIDGVILPVHLKSVDFRARRVTYIGRAPELVVERAVKSVTAIIGG